MAVLLCGYITFVPAIQVWTFSQYYWSLLFILFKALSPCFPSSHFIFPSFPFPFPLQFLFSYFPFCQFPFSCSPFPVPLFPVPPFTQYFKQGDTWGDIRKSSETSTLKLLARYWALHHYKSMLLCNLSRRILFFKLNRKDLTDVIFPWVSFFQEFCVFAMVCLLSDIFLQMVLFVTVLSIDIRRMEVLRLWLFCFM